MEGTALVVGGGIAGSVTALALHRAGIESVVYEAHPMAVDGIGGTVMVAPNGRHALRAVGVEQSVEEFGQPFSSTVMTDGWGRPFGEFEALPELGPTLAVTRADLHRVLREELAAAGVPIEYGKRLVDARETDGGVVATFADGSTATAEVLIGADGIRSAVRTAIDASAPAPKYIGLLGFAGAVPDFPCPGVPEAMYLTNGRHAFFGHWRGPAGGTVWFSNVPDPTPLSITDARKVSDADWLARLRTLHAEDHPAAEILERARPEQLFVFGALEVITATPRWHTDRMVLVGDAVHAPSPVSGQGVSIAVESAVELARCLRDIPDPAAAFATYEQLRRARVERVAREAAFATRGKTPGRVGTAVMRALAPVMKRVLLNPERMFGYTHRHRIEWEQPVAA